MNFHSTKVHRLHLHSTKCTSRNFIPQSAPFAFPKCTMCPSIPQSAPCTILLHKARHKQFHNKKYTTNITRRHVRNATHGFCDRVNCNGQKRAEDQRTTYRYPHTIPRWPPATPRLHHHPARILISTRKARLESSSVGTTNTVSWKATQGIGKLHGDLVSYTVNWTASR
jgi:hypothetical protein